MATDPQQEYAEARAAYREVLARLVEAKKHIPETARARHRRELREERERLASLPPDPRVLEMIESAKRSLRDWASAKLRSDMISSLEVETGRQAGETVPLASKTCGVSDRR